MVNHGVTHVLKESPFPSGHTEPAVAGNCLSPLSPATSIQTAIPSLP